MADRHQAPAGPRTATHSGPVDATAPELTVAQILELMPVPEPPAPVAEAAAAEPDPQPEPAPVPAPAAPAAPAYRPPPPPPPAAPPPAPAPPAISIGSGQHAYINQDRAAAGLAPLNWSGCLAAIAAQSAARMAAAGAISHGDGPSQALGCGLGSGQTGENVGYWTGGINDAQLNQMFLNSAGHRANIMGPYRFVGTAWAVAANGSAYIAVEFG